MKFFKYDKNHFLKKKHFETSKKASFYLFITGGINQLTEVQ